MKRFFVMCGALLALTATEAPAQTAVVNAASFLPGTPLAPGSFAAMFGQNLCGQTAIGTPGTNAAYPVALGGCSVTVNGIAAEIQFVLSGQINFVIPASVPPGTSPVIVNNGGQHVNASVSIGPGPGVFSLNGMGMGEGAMLHSWTWQAGPFSVTTGGQATPISIFMTGLDLGVEPVVTIGGVPATVTWFGNVPGYPGLEQINILLSGSMAGAGRVPVTVTSNGQTSNVTFLSILPTTSMMQGMPGWTSGMSVGENKPREAEMIALAFNPANNTALVSDEAADLVRVISLTSQTTVATIVLPSGSRVHSIAINSTGTLAAVGLTENSAIAMIDLGKNAIAATIDTGFYVSHLAFSGTNLLVTNSASGTVVVIDATSLQVTKTVPVGFGVSGIAVSGNTAVVTNMQAGSISLLDLTTWAVTNISLPAGSRPHEVAISAAAGKALITDPMWNRAFILNLANQSLTSITVPLVGGMGSGGVAANGGFAYVTNQMLATVTVIDMNAGAVLRSFPVDPGPRSIDVNPAANQILVLCQGTGTLDLVDATSYSITARISATSGTTNARWSLATITSISPTSAARGASFTLTINGSNLQSVTDVEFRLAGVMAGGTMGGGNPTYGEDPNIKVTNVSANSAGTQVTATVQILSSAVAGTRQIRIDTDHGSMMGGLGVTTFTVQ